MIFLVIIVTQNSLNSIDIIYENVLILYSSSQLVNIQIELTFHLVNDVNDENIKLFSL